MENAESTEASELELLERVFLRLGVAESDSQLEQALARFLPPVLLKVASSRPTVQSKVLELLTHVNRRLKSRPAVQLPVEKLLTQFTDPSSTPALVNFSLVYVRQGFPRLAPTEQARLLPTLLLSLPIRGPQQQDSILQLCVPALVHLEWPRDVQERRGLLPLTDQSDVRKLLLQFLLPYLMLPYGPLDIKPGQLPPPGLSRALITKVIGGTTPSPDQLEQRKLAIVRLLSSEVLAGNDVICHLIAAAGDAKSSVGELAERYVKQLSHGLDWETPGLVQQLLGLYLGTTATPGKRPHPQSASPGETVTACSLRVRMKILPFLLKSTLATNSFPACIQLVFDSLFGSVTNQKLRSLALQFVHHICRSAAETRLAVMAPVLLTGLYKIVEELDEEVKMKAMAYTGIGLLAKRSPALFRKDPNHLLRLFKSLSKSDVERDVGLAIQECMGLVAPAYRGVGGQTALLLEAALLENVYNTTPQARLMAAVLAGSVFPFSHTPSRYVSMVACGDSKEDVRDAGRKGLIPPVASENEVKDATLRLPPTFPTMVGYLHKRANLILQSGNCYATAAGKLPFAPAIMTEGLKFLRLCLETSAGVMKEQQLTNETLGPVSRYLSELQAAGSGKTLCVDGYLDLLQQSLGPAGDLELHSVAMVGLLQTAAASPSLLAPRLIPQLSWIRGFTHSSRTTVCEPAGRLLGLLSRLLGEGEYLTLAEQIYQDTFSQTHYIQLGAVVSLGHVTSTGVARLVPGQKGEYEGEEPVAMETSQLGRVEEFVKKSLQRLVGLLGSSSSAVHLASPACMALGHACQGGPLPLREGDSETTGGEVEGEGLSKMELIKCLRKKLQGAKEVRLREHCAIALGQMGVSERDSTHCHALLEALFSVREEKAMELQFTVGEAVSCVAVGPLSTALVDPWNTEQRDSSVTPDPGLLAWTVDAILRDHASHPLASVRQSACIWLLSLLKHSSKHPNIQDHLKRLQSVLMSLLAETNEVTQEVAARGMGLTYELCDSSTKQEMVQSLVGTLMEGRKSEHKVTSDTEIFRQGELGKAPEGKGLSTYKELCSIASDLNQPDLVYKFMHLANHNALWNSKKGAAFGFSTIAAASRKELAPHLPVLVPRLYRYKYDPNPRVQLAMSSIWAAVVPESKKAVDQHLNAILEDLTVNLNSSLWRNRQASCMALGDLLVSRLVSEVADLLPSLWELCLRSRDDIKETVRKAANVACKALHKVTVRACESPSTGPKVVKEVLPLLLNKGMQNPSSDIRAISLLAVLKMCENAGSLLKPHIPVLVPALLESLSSLEPQALNTLTLQMTGETDVQEKLDNIRVAASKSSPMMETIGLCTPHIDAEVLSALVPRLVEILKSGVGLGTKTATAQLVVSLVHHSRNDLTPYAGKLLTALTTGLLDRSAGVRKLSARAIGHLVRVSKTTSTKKLLDKMNKWYFEKNDSTVQASVAQVFHAIAEHSPDAAKSAMVDFVPLVFLAMHATASDEDPSSKTALKLWKEAWSEVAPGEEACVRLYLPQLVGVASSALQSQLWPIKAQGAAALATVAEKMGTSLPADQLAGILSALLDGLQGRTWEGKEALLKALHKVCSQNKLAISTGNPPLPSPHTITTALLTQCRKKQQLAYRAVAMETMGGVASSLAVNVFSEFSDIALPIILPPSASRGRRGSGSEGEGEGEERREAAGLRLVLREKTAEAVGKTWPSHAETQVAHFSLVVDTLSTALPLSTWREQLALLSGLHSVFSLLSIEEVSESDTSVIGSQTIPAVCKCLGNLKYSVLRQKALQTLDKITAQLHDRGLLSAMPESTLSELRSSLTTVTGHQGKTLGTAILHRLSSASSS